MRELRTRGSVAVTSHLCDVLADDDGVPPPDALEPTPDVATCVVGERIVS